MPEEIIENELDLQENQQEIWVCQHNSCYQQGSAIVLATFQSSQLPPNVQVKSCSCQGQCSTGPTVRILPEETWYYRVQPSDVSRIVEEHIYGGKPVQNKLNPRIHCIYFPSGVNL